MDVSPEPSNHNVEFEVHLYDNDSNYNHIIPYLQNIDFYDSIPGGKPVNKNTNKWYIITGTKAITDEILLELENYHMIVFQNYELPIENIPKHITHIKIIGTQYEHPLDNLPNNLLYLLIYLRDEYQYSLNNLPISIKVLTIYCTLTEQINIFPFSLIALILQDYTNHSNEIELPYNLVIFDGNIHCLNQIQNSSTKLKLCNIVVEDEYQMSPIIFADGLDHLYLGNCELSFAQIEALPDTVTYMDVQITDDSGFIKFPRSLSKLHMEEYSIILYKTILPSLTNLKYIDIQLRCIYLIFMEILPLSLTEICFSCNSMSDGIFFPQEYIKELVDTNPEFSKYKTTFYKLLYKNNKRSFEEVENDADVNAYDHNDSDNEYDNHLFDIYYDGYINGHKTHVDDSLEFGMINKRIIRKYIKYTIQKLNERGIKVSYF